jgi:hypothetical protein
MASVLASDEEEVEESSLNWRVGAMWTLVIFAIGVSFNTGTQSGTIKGVTSSIECLKKTEGVEKTPGIFTQCIKN